MVADCCNPSISHSPPYSEELLSLYIATVHIPPHKIYYVRWNVWLAYLSTQKCPEGFFFSLPLDGRMRRLYMCEHWWSLWPIGNAIFRFSRFTLLSILSFPFSKKYLKKTMQSEFSITILLKTGWGFFLFISRRIRNLIFFFVEHFFTRSKPKITLCGLNEI